MVVFKLPNKLKVLVVENHKAPVVTIQAWVRTGSADEVKGQEGLSHFIEHLLFKGTQKYQVGEIAKVIEASGGELNAYTSFDQTVFYMTLSSEYIETAMDCLSEMMGRPLFDKTEVDNEREVVIEEIKRSNDSPSRRASYMLFSSLYTKHPYHRPVIGYDHVVKKTPASKIVDLYRSRYCPENMFLIVAGNVNAKKIKPQIQKYFSVLGGKLKKVQRPKDEYLQGPVVDYQKSDFKEGYLNLSFKTWGASEKEMVALELLSYVLSQGETSRLIQLLRIQNQIVNDFGASFFQGLDSSFFTFTSYLSSEKISVALDVMADEILSLMVDPPDKNELNKYVQQIISHDDYQETIDSDARRTGHYEFTYKNPNYHPQYLRLLKNVTSKDIAAVVRKFFQPKNMAVTLLSPSAPNLSEWVESYGLAFESFLKVPAQISIEKTKQTSSKKRLSRREKDVRIVKKHGATIIFKPIEETKVVSCRMGFLGGLRADPVGMPGVNEILSKVWTGGTPTHSEQQFAEKIEKYSSSVIPFSGRNSLGMHLMTLEYQQQNVVQPFFDVLLNPMFPNFQLEREKKVLLNNIKSLEDHPSHLVFMDFMSCLFRGHPYQHETFGSEESVLQTSSKELFQMHKKLIGTSNLTAVVAGAYDPVYWDEQMDFLFSQMPRGEAFKKEFSHESAGEDQKTYKALKKEQSHIVYGFRGIDLRDQRKYALNVLQAILSGQGGRLFMNLRDKASLAYSVAPVRMDGLDTGYFGAYIGCSPDKGAKALQMMKDEFERLIQEPVPEDELLRSQKYLIGKHDISMQKTSTVGSSILFDVLYGVSMTSPEEYKKQTEMVTAKDIQSLAQFLFDQKSVVSCVGPSLPW